MTDKIPQLNADSADDICLKKEGLCVIYLVANEGAKDNTITEMMHSTAQAFSSKINRGINFNFLWLSAEAEEAFFGVFGLEKSELPKIVVLNPSKRKRFMVHDKELNEAGLS